MHEGTMTEYRTGALDYVRYVMEQTGLTPSALAKKANVSSTTLTRPLNDGEHKFAISIATLDKIREATGFDAGPFLSKEMSPIERSIDMHRAKSEYGSSEQLPETKGVPVIGSIQAGAWLDQNFLPIEAETLPFEMVSASRYSETFALLVRDESISRVAGYGDYLLCQRSGDGWESVPGMLVIAERRDKRTGMVEVTARRMKADANGRLWLTFDSGTKPFAERLSFPSAIEHEELKLVATVLYVIRNPIDEIALGIARP